MINKVILVGNVGQDPEIRMTGTGTKVARLTVATSERIKDKNGAYNDRTEWHTVIAWRSLADIAEQHIRKGAQLYVEGSIHYRKYTDKSNIDRISTDIQATTIRLLGRKPATQQNDQPQNVGYQQPQPQSQTYSGYAQSAAGQYPAQGQYQQTQPAAPAPAPASQYAQVPAKPSQQEPDDDLQF